MLDKHLNEGSAERSYLLNHWDKREIKFNQYERQYESCER